MNYFFSINNKNYQSEVTIPKFKNKSVFSSKVYLYSVQAFENKWKYTQVHCPEDDDFFYLTKEFCKNDLIFFLAEKKLYKSNATCLELIDKFTDTEPAFRANLRIFNTNGCFSSYQSEYPFEMINKKGSILSPLILLEEKNEKNIIIFKNIFIDPVKKKFKGYIVDLFNKKILDSFNLLTNYTNCIEINNSHLKKNVFFFTTDFLGIPIFLTENGNNVSLEHTHPLQLYIRGNDGFIKTKKLKNEFLEIIKNEEN